MAAARAGRVLGQQGGQLRGLLPVGGSLFSGAQGCASWQMTIQFSPAVVGSTKAASISSLWRINSHVSSQGGTFSEPRKVKEKVLPSTSSVTSFLSVWTVNSHSSEEFCTFGFFWWRNHVGRVVVFFMSVIWMSYKFF
jgi:hypothetical protein